jgi:membrane protein required for colicin V production
MTAQLNGLDYAIIIIVGFGALYGLGRGALRMATSILSLVLGVYAAATWYGRAGAIAQTNLHTSPTISMVIGYGAVFLIVFVAVEFAGARIVALAHIIHLNWVDRLGGGLFGAALAAIFAGLDIVILTALLPANSPLLQNSQLAPRVLGYNQVLLGYVPPQVKQLYTEKRDDLFRYWEHQKKNPATSTDSSK